MVCSFQCVNAVQDGYYTWHIRCLCGYSYLNDKFSQSHFVHLDVHLLFLCCTAVLFIYFSKFLSENGVMLLIFLYFRVLIPFSEQLYQIWKRFIWIGIQQPKPFWSLSVLMMVTTFVMITLLSGHLGWVQALIKLHSFPLWFVLHSVESCSIW